MFEPNPRRRKQRLEIRRCRDRRRSNRRSKQACWWRARRWAARTIFNIIIRINNRRTSHDHRRRRRHDLPHRAQYGPQRHHRKLQPHRQREPPQRLSRAQRPAPRSPCSTGITWCFCRRCRRSSRAAAHRRCAARRRIRARPSAARIARSCRSTSHGGATQTGRGRPCLCRCARPRWPRRCRLPIASSVSETATCCWRSAR